VVNTWNNHYNG
jgi:hypothetical protein